MKWISVEDRLPDEPGDYLVWAPIPMPSFDDGTLAVDWAITSYGEVYEGWFNWHEYITHWMSLPEPPESDNERSI